MGRLLDEDMVINALQTTKFRNDLFVDRGYARAISIIKELPTIQQEKAQLFKEGTTSDLISKTEVVEHLRRMLESTVPNTDYDEGFIDGVEFGISTVSTMPTIQPQSTTGQLNDGAQSTNLIDRQAAIDGKIVIQRTNGVEIYSDEAVPVEYLKNLPSRQPEPHEGHWIWVAGELMCSECRTIYSDLYPDYDNAVACPHCGAKMKGAQNG